METKIKILGLNQTDDITDNHNIVIESPEENETKRASFREVYQYIIDKGLLTNIQSTQKGIETKIENGVVTIKWFPPNWIEKTQYNKDDLILHNNILYKCIISHMSAEEFNQSYFQVIGVDFKAATTETLGLVQPDGETIMVDENGVIRTSTRSGIFWHVSATEPIENLSATDYWLNTETGEIKQYDGSAWGESLGIMKGPKGDDGKQGLSGPKGEQGEKGDKGDPGERGERGPQGIQGVQGIQGEIGPQGNPFTYDMFTEEQLLNLTGPKGETGPQGEQGETGPTGAPFTYDMFTEEQLLSLTGPRGYSAYEVAVNNGYEDTEEKWLKSLKGETIDNITQNDRTINIYTTNSTTPFSFTIPGGPGEWIDDAATAERFNDYTSTIYFTPGEFSHMEGYQTKVPGKFGHAEGNNTEVSGEAGHAENTLSVAGGKNSHAGGHEGRAMGENSFTHGEYTQSISKNSASFGKQTTTSRENQFVIGSFNLDDSTALFIIGKGDSNTRSNALSVDENGNLWISGQVKPANGYANLIFDWKSGKLYIIGALVFYDNKIYRCIEEHTSIETFDETKWAETSSKTDLKIDEETFHWVINGEDTGISAKGENGVSPIVEVTQTETGCTVTATSGEQVTTAELKNGTNIISTSAEVFVGTLISADWLGEEPPYSQTIIINEITTEIQPILDLIISEDIELGLEEETQWSYINRANSIDNGITFYCYKNKPNIDLNFKVKVV